MELLQHLLDFLYDISFARVAFTNQHVCYIQGWPGYGDTALDAFYDSLDAWLEAYPNDPSTLLEMRGM